MIISPCSQYSVYRSRWTAVTGTGISREALAHLFDKGYSTDGGNGLGLYICRDIIESTGGKITADSSENGAVFRFTVPCGKEDAK